MKKFLVITATVLVLGFGTLTGILYGSGSTWESVYFQYRVNLVTLEVASKVVNHKVTFDEKARLYMECFKENIHCKGLEDIKNLEK